MHTQVVNVYYGSLALFRRSNVQIPVTLWRHDFQTGKGFLGVRAPASVSEADDDILALIAQRAAFLEHRERLARTRRGAKIYRQRATRSRSGRFRDRRPDPLLFPDDLAASCVVVVQLGVPAPVHSHIQLPGRFFFAKAVAQDVSKETGGQAVVEASAQCPVNGPDQRSVV